MRRLHTALGLSSFLAIAGATLMAPTVSSAQPVEGTYVACNQYGDCWRVHRRYAYGADAPITYYNSDWYDAHQNDEHIHWLADPADDRGYYDRDGTLARGSRRSRRGGRSDGRRHRRGDRVSRDASDRVRAWRRGWRGRGWRHGRCRRRSLDAPRLIQPAPIGGGNSVRFLRRFGEKVWICPGLLPARSKGGADIRAHGPDCRQNYRLHRLELCEPAFVAFTSSTGSSP